MKGCYSILIKDTSAGRRVSFCIFAEHIVKRNEAIGQNAAPAPLECEISRSTNHQWSVDLGIRLHDTSQAVHAFRRDGVALRGMAEEPSGLP